MAAGDHAGLIEACAHLGDVSRGGDPHLWTEVLQYFGSQQYDCSAQVALLNTFRLARLVKNTLVSSEMPMPSLKWDVPQLERARCRWSCPLGSHHCRKIRNKLCCSWRVMS